MPKKSKKVYVGYESVNKQGDKFVVVDIEGSTTKSMVVTVRFTTTGHVRKTRYGGVINNTVTDRSKSFYGKGVCKRGSKGKNPKAYRLWYNMLRRCYCPKYHLDRPSYTNVCVCERWLVFENFLDDLPQIPGYETWLSNKWVHLDKDMLHEGNKIYGPGLVHFVTAAENSAAIKFDLDNKNGNPVRHVDTGLCFLTAADVGRLTDYSRHEVYQHLSGPRRGTRWTCEDVCGPWAAEGHELVQHINELRYMDNKTKPVVHIESGEVYEDGSRAAIATGLSIATVSAHCNNRYSVQHFRRLTYEEYQIYWRKRNE